MTTTFPVQDAKAVVATSYRETRDLGGYSRVSKRPSSSSLNRGFESPDWSQLAQQSRCVLLGDPADGSVYCRIESEPLLRVHGPLGTVFMFPALEPAPIYE
jgi:hypothetical protein